QRARIIPKDHSASPLSCGLLKSGKVFVSSFVQTSKGSWRGMVHLPSIPKVIHRQDGRITLSCQVLPAQALTIILGKNPIPERDTHPALSLAKHFCQQRWLDGPLNRPGDFEMHTHKRFRLDDLFEINSWFRCKTGIYQAEGK